MNFNLSSDLAPVVVLVTLAFWVVTIIIHVVFAIAVYRDAASLNTRGTGTVFVGPAIWCLTVLFGGVFLAAIYWVIHHSSFRRSEPVAGNPGPYMWQPLPGSGWRDDRESHNAETSSNDSGNDS